MIELKLPSLGADMDAGTLLQWQIEPGDAVARGQVVAVVDTAKAAIEVESWDAGVVHELLLQPGDKVPVGTAMATLLTPGETPDTARRPPARAEPVPAAGRPRISPAARRRAEALGLAPEALRGSGPEGAVTLADVEAAAATAAPPDKTEAMRDTIARLMSRSKREIPHFYLEETVDFSRARDWLRAWNASHGLEERILPAALMLKAVALAARAHPELNGHWREGRYQGAAAVHLGVVLTLKPAGLVAPALRDAADKPLPRLMAELASLVERARAGRLKSGELSEATLTVSALGEQGAEAVLGVIYPPQVALVGFGRIAERPWVADGKLVVAPLLRLSLAADHRVSDGHRAGRFLAEIRARLEAPESL